MSFKSKEQEELLRDIYDDLGIKDPTPKHLEKLEDGGKVTFECSSCGKGLAVFWVTRPHEPEEYSAYAVCPYCEGEEARSYIKSWRGGFHTGGYLDETVVESVEFTESPMVIKVVAK